MFLVRRVMNVFGACKIGFARMKRNRLQIDRLFCLVVKVAVMVANHEEHVASTLKSLSSDGLILPAEDQHNFEALIEAFVDNDDNTGSEEEHV